jgi:hypothetical protein
MTVTLTLPAPPEPYLRAGLLPATPGTVHGSGLLHRVAAISSGLGGLTATKALKHDLVSITDALVFLARITAQAKSHVHTQTALWVQVVPPTAAAFTAICVLITLYVALIRERKSAEGPRYEMTSAAKYFSCDGHLRRSQRTRKGWY